MTNRRLWKDGAVTIEEAWAQVEAWAASPSSRLIGETDDRLGCSRRAMGSAGGALRSVLTVCEAFADFRRSAGFPAV